MNDFESVRKLGYVGFSDMYLDFISDDEINNKIFSELVQLDTRLGTPASEQLAACFLRTNRSDITKVTSFVLMLDLKLF